MRLLSGVVRVVVRVVVTVSSTTPPESSLTGFVVTKSSHARVGELPAVAV